MSAVSLSSEEGHSLGKRVPTEWGPLKTGAKAKDPFCLDLRVIVP